MNVNPSTVSHTRSEFREVPTQPEFESAHQGATDRPSIGEWSPGTGIPAMTVRNKYLSHWRAVLQREGIPMGEGLIAVEDGDKNIFFRIELQPAAAEQWDLQAVIDRNLPAR